MSFADHLTATAARYQATADRERTEAAQARQDGDLDAAHRLQFRAARHRNTARRLRGQA